MGLALSLHIQLNGDYNHLHPYVGVESEKGYIAGAYYNSIDKLSLYTGYKMELGGYFIRTRCCNRLLR